MPPTDSQTPEIKLWNIKHNQHRAGDIAQWEMRRGTNIQNISEDWALSFKLRIKLYQQKR
jgi:hypothetical protein